MGFALISLTNMLIEASAVTFIMKHLSHYVTANSYLLNAGFLMEFIELISKFSTILLLMLGIYLNPQFLHNFLIIIFSSGSLILVFTTALSYGLLRIRMK